MSVYRFSFTPCVWQRNAYLCGLGLIDVLNLDTLHITPGPKIQLPDSAFPCTVAFIVDGELRLISKHTVMAVRIDTEGATMDIEEHRMKSIVPHSNPVVYEDSVFWISGTSGKVLRANTRGWPIRLEEY